MDLMDKDERVVVLLGDIGVFAFRDVFTKYPTRTYNIGICEQSMVGMAAGLAMAGFIPVIHTITPFLVERAFEQIKDDFGYQKLPGNIIGVSIPLDSNLGYTHQCPYDTLLMSQVIGMNIFVPRSPQEFDEILKKNYDQGLNYIRIQ